MRQYSPSSLYTLRRALLTVFQQLQAEQGMMLSIIKAIALATLFGYQASAVSLRIYTPAQYDFGILTLKEDWTIDSTTRDGFVAMNKDYAQRTIPKGEGNMFALTGMMTWTGDTFDKRAFWMVAEEGDDYRQQTKVSPL